MDYESVKGRFTKGKLFTRTVSALVLIPIALYAIYSGGYQYLAFITIIAAVSLQEWCALSRNPQLSPKHQRIWLVAGTSYLILTLSALAAIRYNEPYGDVLIFWLFLCVWGTDIGAYFFGLTIGGPKIAKKISPNKTWAGLCGAIISSSLIGYWYSQTYYNIPYPFMGAAPILSVIAQAGDFLESHIKRLCGVKDSGNIIPGHGGVLDRIDGLLPAAVLAWIMMKVYL